MTCGGLCPGLNDVVQNIVYTLADYGVPTDQVPPPPPSFPAPPHSCKAAHSGLRTQSRSGALTPCGGQRSPAHSRQPDRCCCCCFGCGNAEAAAFWAAAMGPEQGLLNRSWSQNRNANQEVMRMGCTEVGAAGAAQIFGIKYGLRGFYDRSHKPVHLTPEIVDGIQLRGGTILVGAAATASPPYPPSAADVLSSPRAELTAPSLCSRGLLLCWRLLGGGPPGGHGAAVC